MDFAEVVCDLWLKFCPALKPTNLCVVLETFELKSHSESMSLTKPKIFALGHFTQKHPHPWFWTWFECCMNNCRWALCDSRFFEIILKTLDPSGLHQEQFELLEHSASRNYLGGERQEAPSTWRSQLTSLLPFSADFQGSRLPIVSSSCFPEILA